MTLPFHADTVALSAHPLRVPVHVRFWSKVLVGDDCWGWTGALKDNGYGEFGSGRKTARGSPEVVYAHRYAYESLVGPVPEGLELDHLCRNRACVRPDHMEPVKHKENCRRAHGKGRRRTYQVRSGGTRNGVVNRYVLGLPLEIGRALLGREFDFELTDSGILFRPIPSESHPSPKWAKP